MAWSDPAGGPPPDRLPPQAAASGTTWPALLRLGVRDELGRSVLFRREHSGPLRVQKALYPEGPRVCHAVIVHPPGGIAGGDRLDIEVEVGTNAHALVTTPGATKWYRAPQGMATQAVRLAVAAGAALEWLPQEAIVFNAADADSRVRVDLSGDARFIGWDILCFGRTASNEAFASGRYRQRWELRHDGRLLWNEFGALDGGGALMAAPAGMAGQPVCGTLLASGPDQPAALLERLRVELDALPCARCVAATRMGRIIAVRYLGPSTEEARDAFTRAWSLLRGAMTGIIADPPRLWRT